VRGTLGRTVPLGDNARHTVNPEEWPPRREIRRRAVVSGVERFAGPLRQVPV
jgi:hypothetical protein